MPPQAKILLTDDNLACLFDRCDLYPLLFMGVNHLWGILDPVQEIVPLETLSGKHLCIDLSFWLCELCLSNVHSKEKSYLKGLFHRIRALLALNCRITFVADGAVPAIKLPVYSQRLQGSSLPLQPIPIRENASSGRRHKSSEFGRMVEEAKAVARAMGIAVITSVEEAEAQCALLNSAGICDVCCTGDSDAFLFGAQVVMRRIDLHPAHTTATLYRAARIRDELGFGCASLIALALLLGSDYSPKFKGIGKDKAVKVVRAAGDEAVLEQVVAGGVRQLTRTTKLGGADKKWQGGDADEEKLAKQCMEAYLHPNCHPALSPIVQQALSVAGNVHLPDLVALMGEQMGWRAEQTERYILPKIAERDLRRAAQGCQGGYKVMRVVKLRVRYGCEYYEVTWSGEAPVSVVPAHLVRIAFPLEVAEFMREKGKTKKGMGGICASLEQLQVCRPTQQNHELSRKEKIDDSSVVQSEGCSQGCVTPVKEDGDVWLRRRRGGVPLVDLGSPSPIALPRKQQREGEDKLSLLSHETDSESDVECVDPTSFLQAQARRTMRGKGVGWT